MFSVSVEGKELKYAAIGAGFIMVWFLWLKKLLLPYLSTMPPFQAMLFYNAGFLVGLYFIMSLLNGERTIKMTVLAFMIFVGVDLVAAPYLLNEKGELAKGADYWFVSSDAGFASLWASAGVKGGSLWAFTYLVTPLALLLIFPVLIADPGAIIRAFR